MVFNTEVLEHPHIGGKSAFGRQGGKELKFVEHLLSS